MDRIKDNFTEFKGQEFSIEAVMWHGFLIGDLHSRLNILKEDIEQLTKQDVISKELQNITEDKNDE